MSPELVDARTGTTRWQRSFDAALTDVFEIQGQIAGDVADALEPRAGGAGPAGLAARAPLRSLEAYTLYLHGQGPARRRGRARGAARRAGGVPAGGGDRSRFRRRLGRARGRARGCAAAGRACATDDAEQARRAVERAAELAPESPDTRKARGRYAARGPRQRGIRPGGVPRRAAHRARTGAISSMPRPRRRWTWGCGPRRSRTWSTRRGWIPSPPDVIGDLGVAYMRLRRYRRGARRLLERARALRPCSMSLAHIAGPARRHGGRPRRHPPGVPVDGGDRGAAAGGRVRGPAGGSGLGAGRRSGAATLLDLTPADLDGGGPIGRWRGRRCTGCGATRKLSPGLWRQRRGRVHRAAGGVRRPGGPQPAGRDPRAVAGLCRARSERRSPRASARRRSGRRTRTPRRPTSGTSWRGSHVLAGRPDAALDRLEALVAEPGLRAVGCSGSIRTSTPIRENPRFVRLVSSGASIEERHQQSQAEQ